MSTNAAAVMLLCRDKQEGEGRRKRKLIETRKMKCDTVPPSNLSIHAAKNIIVFRASPT